MTEAGKTQLPPLSARMQAIVSMVDPCRTAADIGCDHGYVSVTLCATGICEKCIASDIGEGPALHAGKSVQAWNLSDRISVRVGNGLDTVGADEADCIIIAGMGGETILSILEGGMEKACFAEQLVLGPQSEVKKVREWLSASGFSIRDEKYIEDGGKYYPLISASFTGNRICLTDEEYAYGPILLNRKDETLFSYLRKRLNWLGKILENIRDSEAERTAQRSAELTAECRMIRKVLENEE